MSKLAKEYWIDREALVRPAICTHVFKKNEFEPGVRVYVAGKVDRDFGIGILLAILFGGIWSACLFLSTGSV